LFDVFIIIFFSYIDRALFFVSRTYARNNVLSEYHSKGSNWWLVCPAKL